MAHVYTEESNFENIADAIREKNGTDTQYLPSEMADAIRDIEPNLEEQTIDIRSNSTIEIIPSEGFDGISKAKIITMVSGSNEGVDLTAIGCTPEETNEYNGFYKAGIEKAKDIYATWKNESNKVAAYTNKTDVIYFPKVDCSNMTDCSSMFNRTYNLNVAYCVNWKPKTCEYVFTRTGKLRKVYGIIDLELATSARSFFQESGIEEMPHLINTHNLINVRSFFQYCFSLNEIYFDSASAQDMYAFMQNCTNATKATITSLENATNISIFCTESRNLEELYIGKYKQLNLDLSQQNVLKIESIKYLIFNAINSTDGASDRDVTLHATTYAKWEEIKNTNPIESDKTILGVEDLGEYATMTWSYIASEIKGITIKSA